MPETLRCHATRADGTVCGYTWTPRPSRYEHASRRAPVACPSCKSHSWNKERKEIAK